jgi:putative spermidine/putrescine transport system substrate-binding protein
MQAAGRTDIDLVLTGVGALSAGIDQGLWVKVLPDYAAKFPSVLDNYLPAARSKRSAGRHVHACRATA